MQERRATGNEGYKKGVRQERRETGKEGFALDTLI